MSLQGPALSIPAGAKSAKGLLRLPLPANTADADAKGATLTDDTAFPKLTFANQGVSVAGSNRYLYFLADASDVPPVSFSYARRAILRFARSALTLEYNITNQATQIDKLRSVIAASDWSALDGPVPLVVSTADSPATRLELSGVFTEKSTHVALPRDAVLLCDQVDSECGEIAIPSYSTKTLYLRYRGPRKPGVYTGQIALHALEYASGTPSPLTVYVSPGYCVAMGIFVVGLGVLLAWWVKTWSSNRIARDQALLPVAAYQARLRGLTDTLHTAVTQLGTPCPVLAGKLEDWTAQMDPAWLETKYGLPGASPYPNQRIGAISNDFMSFLTQADAAITLLSVFVVDGIKRVAELTALERILPQQAPKTVVAIDAYYSTTLKLDEATKHVGDLIDKAQTLRLAPAAVGSAAAAAAKSAAAAGLSFTSLLVEIRTLNRVAWCVLLGVSAAGTIFAFVLKPGFGKPSDYLLCFITAFGVPTIGGAAIPSQTASTTVTKSTTGTSGSRPSPNGGAPVVGV
jgi:hypothetical protein